MATPCKTTFLSPFFSAHGPLPWLEFNIQRHGQMQPDTVGLWQTQRGCARSVIAGISRVVVVQLLTDRLFGATAGISQVVHLILDVAPGSLHSLASLLVKCLFDTFVSSRIPITQVFLASLAPEIASQQFARCLVFAVAIAPLLFAAWGCITRLLWRVGRGQVAIGICVGIWQKVCLIFARIHGLHVVCTHGVGIVSAALGCLPSNHILQSRGGDGL